MSQKTKKGAGLSFKSNCRNGWIEYRACTLPSVVSEMKAWKNHGTKFLFELKRYQALNPVTGYRDEF